jgi:alpha-L-arabinofuranosidase
VQTQFVISVKTPGTLWLNLVSLMPPTFHNTANGNRIDIMNLLDEMHPGFLRFPGGNYVEGNRFDDHYDWRRTLGPMENRPGHQGTWSYRSSDGMGLLEYLMWCEDLKMEPVLAVFAGHILGNGNTAVTGDRLEPYVQEALDEIEYVTGDATTKWGAERAKGGHAAPFKLTYVEVGNEDNLSNGLGTYEERFTRFYDAIKGKYPNLKIISTVPSNQRNYERNRTPDVIDDHYYFNNVSAALTEVDHYDNYDRSGPKIFVGEWATRLGNPTSNFLGAMADAAFLTGLERNADLVVMSCYAPLFVNVNPPYPQSAGGLNYPGGMQWPTDLIGYNADASFGSCSYYVQKMFYNNLGDVVLPIELPNNPDVFACASRDTNGDVILKMVSGRGTAAGMDITLSGVKDVDKNATGWILTGGLDDVNSVAEPEKVAPKEITIDNAAAKFTYSLPSNSVVVLRIKAK